MEEWVGLCAVDARGRLGLPKEVRRALDVEAGDYVGFAVAPDGAVVLSKLTIRAALRGSS